MKIPTPAQPAVQPGLGAQASPARRLDAADLAELAPANPTPSPPKSAAQLVPTDARPQRPGSRLDIRV